MSTSTAAATATAAAEPPEPGSRRPLRVCVLNSSYEGSASQMKEYEGDLLCSPSHFITDDPNYAITNVFLKKATTYSVLRQIIKEDAYDVYFNLCDGAKDEDRAGEEVVKTLEEFNCAFTGAIAKFYEISKPDMKMIAHYNGINHAAFAVIESVEEVDVRCAHMRFPVIIKHISGYSSIGMTRDSKCPDMSALKVRVAIFLAEFQTALVEEFVEGDEVTVLACTDSSAPEGIRVLHPVMINFPEGEDFKHFELKWAAFEGMQWARVPDDDPALAEILSVGRKAFKYMMGGVGYGRCDLRINRRTNEVVFLEINPNCGIMYPRGEEGSADWILRLDGTMDHRQFAVLQIEEALQRQRRLRPLFKRDFMPHKGYYLVAVTDIAEGTVIMDDEGRAFRLFTRPFVMRTWPRRDFDEHFRTSAWPIGHDHHYYAIWDSDPTQWRSFNHSCDPNMIFQPPESLNVIARRNIRKGEELTMDYLSFCDEMMRPFTCNCGSAGCKGTITPKQALRIRSAPQFNEEELLLEKVV